MTAAYEQCKGSCDHTSDFCLRKDNFAREMFPKFNEGSSRVFISPGQKVRPIRMVPGLFRAFRASTSVLIWSRTSKNKKNP